MINYATLGSLITPAKVIRCGNDSFPVLSMTMHNGIVMQSERFKKKLASADQSDYKVVKRGQLVVGFPIDEGVLYVQKAADEGIMSPAYNVWDIDSKVIDPDFLELCLHSPQSMQYYKNKLRGTTARRRSIPVSDLEALKIRLPDMQTQHEIVAIIKKAEAIIVDRQEQLDYFEQLVKSRFVELFGDPFINSMKWKRLKIKDAVTVEPQNGMYKPQSDYVTDGSGTPILRIDSFYNGVVTDFTLLKRLLCNEKDKRKYLLKEDDIIINRVNSIEYLGKCAHITGLLEETVYESNMMRIHFDSKRFNPIYVVQLLGSRFVYDQIVNHAKKAVNQASINQKDILDLDIYEPPLALQDQFAAFVKQVDKSKYCSQKFEELCHELIKIYEQEWM